MYFQIALTFEHMAGWLNSVQQARRVADEKEDRRRIAVKPKSADD